MQCILNRITLLATPVIFFLWLSTEISPAGCAFVTFQNEPTSARGTRRSSRSSRHQQATSSTSQAGAGEATERTGGRTAGSKLIPQTPWTRYMIKYDIARCHGSGIFVDIGGYEAVGNKYYRMPTGKCPVMGKVISLASGADFLEPISADNPRYRGLAFPETVIKHTGASAGALTNAGNIHGNLSPVSAADLRKWGYKGNAVTNCAEYASNIVPGSDQRTKYRYPFVYDGKEEMCYILYSPMQYNQGTRYCDEDGSAKEGPSSLLCMKPYKSEADAHLYYGSARIDPKWDQNCPMKPIKDAIFGTWVSGACVALESAFEEYVNSAEECAAILFENSAADVDIDIDSERYNEISELYNGLKNLQLQQIAFSLFAPMAKSAASATLSKGVGMNWANYESETGVCRILNATPTCLIINAGSLAMTALGSPLESDAINYPCHIDTLGYVEPRKRDSREDGDRNSGITTALNMKTLKCTKYVHSKYSESCGTYYYCSEEKSGYLSRLYQFMCSHNVKKAAVISTALVLLCLAIYWIYQRLWSTKKGRQHDDYDRLMSKYEYDDVSHDNIEPEHQLRTDAYIWGEAAARPSDITPVHLTKLN
uniref:Apical membrane antigen 1 n=2 Tax=Babesia bigemina TaxID=5866 RepID=H2D7G2_BABBI|nr:apical membrane antigen 1 [Babesia bigemina]